MSARRESGFTLLEVLVATMLMAAIGWLHPRIRHLETEIPDQIPDTAAPATGAGSPPA